MSCTRRAASTAAAGSPPAIQAQLHLGEAGHVTVQRALRNPRSQSSGVPEPAGTLLLVAARHVKHPESHCAHRGLDRAGVGKEGVVRGSTEAQRIVGAAEPPHGVGVGCEVVGGQLLGLENVELRGGGGPISCRSSPPRLCQGVAVLVHPMPPCGSHVSAGQAYRFGLIVRGGRSRIRAWEARASARCEIVRFQMEHGGCSERRD